MWVVGNLVDKLWVIYAVGYCVVVEGTIKSFEYIRDRFFKMFL